MDGNPSGGGRRRTVTPRAGGRTRRHRKATGMRASERHGSPARTRSGTCRSAAGGSLYPRGVSPSAEVWAAAGRALSQGPIDGDKTAYAWDHSDGRPAGELPSSASEMKRTRRWFIRAAVRGGCCTCGCGCGCCVACGIACSPGKSLLLSSSSPRSIGMLSRRVYYFVFSGWMILIR